MHEPHRMLGVQPPIIPILADLIRRSPGTISLGQGVVSYPPPPEALHALADFPSSPEDHRYGPVEGSPALVDAIWSKLAREQGIARDDSRRAVVTAGGNMAFLNAVLAVTDPGDEVVLQAPFYFNHDMAIAIAGCRTVSAPTDASYQLQPDAIRAAITPRTRAVVTISPNNPTGAVYPESAIRAVNALCAEHGLYHVHDEAYEYFIYGDTRHFSPAAIGGAGRHTITLYSLSKTYGMASWRIGYMLIPSHLFEAVNKIQDTNLICPAVVSQRVAEAALRVGSGYCLAKVETLGRVRQLVLQQLARLGDTCTVPPADGAFYCLLRVNPGSGPSGGRGSLDGLSVATRLIRDHRVAVVPGEAFGLRDGCYLRVSYGALDAASVAEGLSRLVEGLRAIV